MKPDDRELDLHADYPDFLGSEIASAPSSEAAFSVLPVPYERTTSYAGGTVRGPSSILKASWQLETWDGMSNPSTGGIHTCQPVDCEGADPQVIERIADKVAELVQTGSMPVVLGGEHSITHGTVHGLLKGGLLGFGVIQIDAHADLREAYEGNPYSHASVMKRVVDLGIPIYQLGVRALCEEERITRREHDIVHRDAEELVQNGIHEVSLPESFPEKVFITLDVDGLDPSVFPSTGTPVPGGLGWYQTLNLISSIARQREIIGFDVVEFSPIKGLHAYDFAAALLTYKVLGIIQRGPSEPG